MPTVMNFNTLIANLQSYLERGSSTVDPTVYAQLPFLINAAERDIAKRLKILGFLVPVNSVLVPGQPAYQKPSGWRQTVSMNYGAGTDSNVRTPILPRAYEYCRNYWPDDSQTAPPEYYADYDYYDWLISPTPDQAYPWEILYYQQPPLLDNVNTTNWLTNEAPMTLLYRALLECTPYLKDDSRIQVWQSYFDSSIANLSGEEIQKIYDRTTTRKTD